jgi:hypothetical protein
VMQVVAVETVNVTMPQRSLHQPQALSTPPFPMIASQ